MAGAQQRTGRASRGKQFAWVIYDGDQNVARSSDDIGASTQRLTETGREPPVVRQ
jgi:hypothetical protein